MVVKTDVTPQKLIFTTVSDGMSVSLHQLNQTDVVKRLHHLLLIQYILGKLKKSSSQRDENSVFCFMPFLLCIPFFPYMVLFYC